MCSLSIVEKLMLEWLKACLLFEAAADILFTSWVIPFRYQNNCSVFVTLGRYVENFCYGKIAKFWFTNPLGYVKYFRQFTGKEKCLSADLVDTTKILKHICKKMVMMSVVLYFVAKKCSFPCAVPIAYLQRHITILLFQKKSI